MTRILLAIFSLPLAFVVGCGELNCTGDECINEGCAAEAAAHDADYEVYCAEPDDFSATLRSVAPYGWVGDHGYRADDGHAGTEYFCENVQECEMLAEKAEGYEAVLKSDIFRCVNQLVTVSEDGEVLEVSDAWLGEGICFLTPDGEYSGMNVRTIVDDENGIDQGWIGIESWGAVITGNTFFYEGDEYLLEGTIADDLSWISWYIGGPGTSGGDQDTIYLED